MGDDEPADLVLIEVATVDHGNRQGSVGGVRARPPAQGQLMLVELGGFEPPTFAFEGRARPSGAGCRVLIVRCIRCMLITRWRYGGQQGAKAVT